MIIFDYVLKESNDFSPFIKNNQFNKKEVNDFLMNCCEENKLKIAFFYSEEIDEGANNGGFEEYLIFHIIGIKDKELVSFEVIFTKHHTLHEDPLFNKNENIEAPPVQENREMLSKDIPRLTEIHGDYLAENDLRNYLLTKLVKNKVNKF
jgi:hypothetical protein